MGLRNISGEKNCWVKQFIWKTFFTFTCSSVTMKFEKKMIT